MAKDSKANCVVKGFVQVSASLIKSRKASELPRVYLFLPLTDIKCILCGVCMCVQYPKLAESSLSLPSLREVIYVCTYVHIIYGTYCIRICM